MNNLINEFSNDDISLQNKSSNPKNEIHILKEKRRNLEI